MEEENRNNKSWYVVQAVAQYEGSVKRLMLEHIKRKGLDDYFGDILVPTEEVIEIRDGQKRKVERKFFPGYILVNMEMTEDAWHLVRHIPRVLGFVGGTADKPAPISKREVDKILGRIEGIADKPKPQHSFVPGEAVRIKEGPFADFEGVVEEAHYDKNRLSVAVMIFGRSTPVDLEFRQVEKIT